MVSVLGNAEADKYRVFRSSSEYRKDGGHRRDVAPSHREPVSGFFMQRLSSKEALNVIFCGSQVRPPQRAPCVDRSDLAWPMIPG